MANMTFKANLYPETSLGYSLGSSNLKWKINDAYVFPMYYSNIDYSSTSVEAGAFTLNGQQHPVTGITEYGSALILPAYNNNVTGYNAQIIISSAAGQAAPAHMYIRRLTAADGWSNWSTILDNNNYSTYLDGRYVNVTGDTMTGTLKFNKASDIGLLKNTYNNTEYNLIRNHNNGNISVSASSVGLYLGYENTTKIDFLNGRQNMAGYQFTVGKSSGTDGESQIKAVNVAGTIYMYSQTSTTANRGLYGANSSGTSVSILTVSSSNVVQLNGNASTADKWKTARTLTIGNTGKAVDGSANVSWSKDEILGASDSSKFLRGDKAWSNEIVSAGTTDAGGNILRLRTTATIAAGYQYGINHLVPNLTGSSNSNTILLTGVANSAGNQGYLGFHYVGTANAGNWVSLGIYGKDHLFKCFYNGKVAIHGTVTNSSAWKEGTTAIGQDSFDKGVIGYCASNTNGVVFGAHNSALNAWAPVNLSGTQVNFRQQETLMFTMNSSRILNNYVATTLGTAPSSNTYLGGLHFIDTAGNDVGYYRCFHWTNQVIGLQIEARRSIDGTMKYNTLNLGIDTSGNATVGIGGTNAAANWRTAIGAAASSHTHSYLPLSGGAMTGAIQYNGKGQCSIYNGPNDQFAAVGGTLNNLVISSWWGISFTTACTGQTYSGKTAVSIDCRNGLLRAAKVYGAVWNDYAEYRQSNELEPGRCIVENGDGTLSRSTQRLQKGCEIVSDTYGFAIGENSTCKTPTATCGRVLAYLYEDREIAKQHIGDPVCSGPNGTVSIMTEEEEMRYSSRIIGTISEVPNYDIWHAGSQGQNKSEEIKVNGRIWIRIR